MRSIPLGWAISGVIVGALGWAYNLMTLGAIINGVDVGHGWITPWLDNPWDCSVPMVCPVTKPMGNTCAELHPLHLAVFRCENDVAPSRQEDFKLRHYP